MSSLLFQRKTSESKMTETGIRGIKEEDGEEVDTQ